jgi:putative CocE/NonD family hydrolase
VIADFDVPARMRDGVTLRANVYRPEGGGPWPTLLARIPYGKDGPKGWLDPLQTAREGFMVVVQDSRGRSASGGEWMLVHSEREDGYDTVEWAAQLPGSNGRVGMYDLSYFGVAQWMAAFEQPPSLRAIAPAMSVKDPLEGGLVRGGALELGLIAAWTLALGGERLVRLPIAEQERGERMALLLHDLDRLPTDGYWDLPVHDLAVLRRHGLGELLAAQALEDPDVVARCRVAGEYERVMVPSFNIGGWHDVLVQGVLDNYMALAALGRPARLVVGPWTHATHADPIGELRFGAHSARLGAPAHPHGDLGDEQLAWFRPLLDPDAPSEAEESGAPVRIFVMGRNKWRDEVAWPLARARQERWFLGAGGVLRTAVPDAKATPTEFTYDPADPVLTLGGQIFLTPAFPAGPRDQARIETRSDVCVFTSEPLRKDLEVTGRVRVVLHAESSAPSTDWVARLCDVHPDGRSFNICDGILRIEPGADRLQEIAIDLWSTSNVFLAGHRLRVHVTSSSFPRWDRNLNTGNQRESRMQSARQRVHHDTDHTSFIELPVIDA